jgi:hypothetical protein
MPETRRALIYFRGDTVTEPSLIAALKAGAMERLAIARPGVWLRASFFR